jgi:phenylacetate-CoA ligase
MSITNELYKRMPWFVQNFGISIYGLNWHIRRFYGIYSIEFKTFILREKFDKKKWEEEKLKRLKLILVHAFEFVPYYKNLFMSLGFDSKVLQNLTMEDFVNFPILNKDTLRTQGVNDLLSIKTEKGGAYFSSSGSSGTPTKILYSKKMHQRYAAAHEARCRNWAGVTRFDARGMIGGRRVVPEGNAKAPFHRYNFIEKQVYYSAYHISPANATDYVEAMWKYNIQYMTGYAVSNYLLALYIKQQGLKVPKLKAVITSSEKLTAEMRSILEEVYQCKAFDGWSGVEACGMVTECEEGSLHISEDVGLVEILDENGNEVSEGEIGEVVCTGFLNYDQPLIRYRIGDRMTKGIGTCKCGRQMPVIKEIDGRIEDVITGSDGRQMVRFHGVFIGLSSIEKAQVIQHRLDYIEIKIQNTIDLSNEDIQLLKQRIISQLGNVDVHVEQHAIIEQAANGKYKAVISKIN